MKQSSITIRIYQSLKGQKLRFFLNKAVAFHKFHAPLQNSQLESIRYILGAKLSVVSILFGAVAYIPSAARSKSDDFICVSENGHASLVFP
jgi:hypothetical protein